MSQENVEIVRRLYADPRGLTAATNEMVAPEAEFDFTAVYPTSRSLRASTRPAISAIVGRGADLHSVRTRALLRR